MSISSTIVERADIRFHPAAPQLQSYVGCFWVITAAHGSTVRIVPDSTTSIAFEQQSGETVGYLRGPLLQPAELRFDVPTTLIGVRLRPGVAFSLSGVVAHSLVNRRISIQEIDALQPLSTIDPSPCTPSEWIDVLQRFLEQRLVGSSIHPLVEKALVVIQAEHGDVSVAKVAAHCGVGERHLVRLMRDWIGFGPKRYAGIVRFQSTLAHMERAPQAPMAALAAQVGYFDQSHLAIDTERYAGATPGHLATQRVSDFSKTRCDVPF